MPIFWSVLAALSLSPQIANIAKQRILPLIVDSIYAFGSRTNRRA